MIYTCSAPQSDRLIFSFVKNIHVVCEKMWHFGIDQSKCPRYYTTIQDITMDVPAIKPASTVLQSQNSPVFYSHMTMVVIKVTFWNKFGFKIKNASSKNISVNCTGTKAVCILRSGCHLCFSFWDDEAFQIVFTNYLRDGRGWSREICRKFHGPVALYANVFTHAATMYLPKKSHSELDF